MALIEDDAVRKAWIDLRASLIAVAPNLDEPYSDAPEWTPWSRFVGPAIERMDGALRRHTCDARATP